MQSFVVTLLAVLLVAVLFITNPDTETFAQTYAGEISQELASDLGLGGAGGDLLGNLGRGVIAQAIEQETERSNYLIASVYTITTPDEDVRVLGIAGQFIRL